MSWLKDAFWSVVYGFYLLAELFASLRERKSYMFCVKCDKRLWECTCPDLAERAEIVFASPYVHVSPDVKKKIREQAAKNKAEQSRAE